MSVIKTARTWSLVGRSGEATMMFIQCITWGTVSPLFLHIPHSLERGSPRRVRVRNVHARMDDLYAMNFWAAECATWPHAAYEYIHCVCVCVENPASIKKENPASCVHAPGHHVEFFANVRAQKCSLRRRRRERRAPRV